MEQPKALMQESIHIENNGTLGDNQYLNWKFILPGVLALLSAVPIAFIIQYINLTFSGQPEKVVIIVGILFGGILGVPAGGYVLVKRRQANPGMLGLLVFAVITVLLVSIYLFWVSGYVRFPADILIWSESDFVNDILKFRVGYPLYSLQINNDSFTYVPGPQLITYFFAWLSGNPTSITVYRMIQVGYTLLATLLAALSGRIILEMSGEQSSFSKWKLWSMIWVPFLFLAATNSITNPFVHDLHDDSLAQLASVFAFYLLLRYIQHREKSVLGLMALFPAASFLIKQSLITWAFMYCFYLAIFDRPLKLKKLLLFAVVSFGLIGVVLIGSYLIWGAPFFYWVFSVLGSHGVSPLRSFQHLLVVWPFYTIGIVGGYILLREKNYFKLLSPWLIWLLIILSETYTSGIAWMTNHIGPGSLIAAIWFVAALPKLWSIVTGFQAKVFGFQDWIRSGMVLTIFCFLFSGVGVFRIPLPALSSDAYRYIAQIEQQFAGQPANRVLLDVGSWVYIKDQVIMKDRAPSIGERGYSETGDFSGMIQRLNQHFYSKILVRNLDSPDFWYENYLWPKPSGIKQALLDNYHVVGKINGVEGSDNYLLGDISILVPNSR